MGSGVWLKHMMSKKKVKGEESHKAKRYSDPQTINGCNDELCLVKECPIVASDASVDDQGSRALSIEDAAATKIQTSYRAYTARRNSRQISGMARLKNLVDRDSVKTQALTTLSRLQSWTKTQAQIRTRRAHMVMDGRLRQKKLENQLKLEATIHDLEVEWNGGSETMSEALAKIHHREAAAVRRQRAMAYAFTHQWRANSAPSFGSDNQEVSKANWGWSWMDRWIAARPWESRVAALDSPKNAQTRHPNKAVINKPSPTSKPPENVKLTSPNLKAARKGRKLSYETAAVKKMSMKSEEKKRKNERKALASNDLLSEKFTN